MKTFFHWTILSAAVALLGCSTLESDKIDYRSAGKAPALNVPPDLTQLTRDSRYALVDGAVSSVGMKAGSATPAAAPVGTPALGDVRIERAGDQRWLVIKRPAEQLWEPLKGFWLENGFTLAQEQRTLGILETEWAENRAKIPQDFIRSALGRALDMLYSTGERDKFRTRLETNAQGETEIYISHRGVIEVYTSESKSQTVWQPRPSDPELEAEFMRRLMVKLGAPADQAKAQVASSPATQISRIVTVNGQSILQIQEGFDRAWRRVGLTLDRTGFTVEDRDRKQGLYFVRYVEAEEGNADQGFFGKLFSSPKAPQAVKFQIAVRPGEKETSTVSVLDAKGDADNSPTAQRIVKVLAQDIN